MCLLAEPAAELRQPGLQRGLRRAARGADLVLVAGAAAAHRAELLAQRAAGLGHGGGGDAVLHRGQRIRHAALRQRRRLRRLLLARQKPPVHRGGGELQLIELGAHRLGGAAVRAAGTRRALGQGLGNRRAERALDHLGNLGLRHASGRRRLRAQEGPVLQPRGLQALLVLEPRQRALQGERVLGQRGAGRGRRRSPVQLLEPRQPLAHLLELGLGLRARHALLDEVQHRVQRALLVAQLVRLVHARIALPRARNALVSSQGRLAGRPVGAAEAAGAERAAQRGQGLGPRPGRHMRAGGAQARRIWGLAVSRGLLTSCYTPNLGVVADCVCCCVCCVACATEEISIKQRC